MAATPARIGFILQQFRTAVSETAGVKTMFGSLARQSGDPIPTFFDSEADAQAIADARQALLSVTRRRFKVVAAGVEDLIDTAYVGDVPIARYLDPERGADFTGVLCELVFDLGKNQTTTTVWG